MSFKTNLSLIVFKLFSVRLWQKDYFRRQPTYSFNYGRRFCKGRQCKFTKNRHFDGRNVVRYHQVLLRSRFDANKCVTDAKDKRLLYRIGKYELFMTQHPMPIAKFPRSAGLAGGAAHGRAVAAPDWLLDYWHPLEKARFPHYFRRREARKREYIEKWESGELM